MFEFKDKKDFTLTVRIEKQGLSEKEGYYFHNYEPEPWVVEITGKACAQGLTRLGYRKMKSPEEILELIDNYAETQHTCGHWTYNLKSNESRQKVIAALKGEV